MKTLLKYLLLFFFVFLFFSTPKKRRTRHGSNWKKNCGRFFVFHSSLQRRREKKEKLPFSPPCPPDPPINNHFPYRVHRWMITSPSRVHQWWSITMSKNLWALKIALNFMDTLATQCILFFFLLFLFLFVTWEVYPESKLLSMLGMYRAMCRHVIYHVEDPTCASRILKKKKQDVPFLPAR